MTTAAEALAKWAGRADVEVTLPTGQLAKVRVPELVEVIRDASLPADLRNMALRFDVAQLDTNTMTPDELLLLAAMRDQLVARTLVALDVDGTWIEVELDPDEVPSLGLPAADTTALENIALRRQTPNMVTAGSLRDLGRLSAADAAAVARKEAAGTVTAFGPFRDQHGRSRAGTSGADVQSVAEQPTGHRRPSHPAGGGSGTGAAAAGG